MAMPHFTLNLTNITPKLLIRQNSILTSTVI